MLQPRRIFCDHPCPVGAAIFPGSLSVALFFTLFYLFCVTVSLLLLLHFPIVTVFFCLCLCVRPLFCCPVNYFSCTGQLLEDCLARRVLLWPCVTQSFVEAAYSKWNSVVAFIFLKELNVSSALKTSFSINVLFVCRVWIVDFGTKLILKNSEPSTKPYVKFLVSKSWVSMLRPVDQRMACIFLSANHKLIIGCHVSWEYFNYMRGF